ncbi:MAG: NAD-dependent epimerase/dehydratase family protein [Alphaproteobacteria bacterium]|nr:NAD-dependent epimerase/dehydratase family protein [Alphaproteobacteria bacterium]
MKILVTGGAGFIGSHLSERLVREGHHVTALDNLSTGSLSNLAALSEHPGLEAVIGSVRDASLVEDLVDAADLVIHLAAAVGVQLIMDRPSQSLLTNVEGTENVVRAASRAGRKVLIASTSEVYGKSASVPFREDDDIVMGPTAKIRWSYAYAKALDECLAVAYAHEGKLQAVIARFFNTTGPRQTGRYGMVLPNFVSCALQGKPLMVHGTGEQSRCFGHVKDAVEAIVRLIGTPEAVGQIFNIGNDEEISIMGLAQRVCAATASSSEIRLVPYSEAYGPGFEDMPRRVPDVSRLERVVGFRPRTPLDAIIADVIAEKRVELGL